MKHFPDNCARKEQRRNSCISCFITLLTTPPPFKCTALSRVVEENKFVVRSLALSLSLSLEICLCVRDVSCPRRRCRQIAGGGGGGPVQAVLPDQAFTDRESYVSGVLASATKPASSPSLRAARVLSSLLAGCAAPHIRNSGACALMTSGDGLRMRRGSVTLSRGTCRPAT